MFAGYTWRDSNGICVEVRKLSPKIKQKTPGFMQPICKCILNLMSKRHFIT